MNIECTMAIFLYVVLARYEKIFIFYMIKTIGEYVYRYIYEPLNIAIMNCSA